MTPHANLISTRDDTITPVGFKEALLNPAAKYGGLYTFATLPTLSLEQIECFKELSYKQLCAEIFSLLGLGLDSELLSCALEGYDGFDDNQNPAPLSSFGDELYCLELFHGQTRAFKDMALQPFGRLLSHFAKDIKQQEGQECLILVATSGDTGPATLQSFANKEAISVICLYPRGGTSDVQRLQMTTQEAKNLKVIGLEGDFDDAQSALKSLLADKDFAEKLKAKHLALSAANSVNIGRIVFQIIYHIWGYLQLLKNEKLTLGEKLSIIVPSGNFGNILGAFFAKKMGLPLGKLIIASNANNILSDFVQSGVYDISHRRLIKTKSPAMDILKSSNVERMLYALFGAARTKELMESLEREGKYCLNPSELALLQQDFDAFYCDDRESLSAIKEAFEKQGALLCPHSAIGYAVAKRAQEEGKIHKALFVATAEWSKFAPSVFEAISGVKNLSDEEAIKKLCALSHPNAKLNATSIAAPSQILELFNKSEAQNDVIAPALLKEHILQWLDTPQGS